MKRVFISYKRKDLQKVIEIKNRIESETGEKCWIDLEGIDYTRQFASVICRAIDDAEIVLFVYSNQHMNIDLENDWTIKEINYANKTGKQVILLQIDNTPLYNIFLLNFGTKNNCNVNDDAQFKKLIDTIKRKLVNQSASKQVNDYDINSSDNQTLEFSIGRYVGQIKFGEPNGRGTLYYVEGDRYEGEFKDGEINGRGTFYLASGDRYEGEFKDGVINGRGALYYVDGNRYEGGFKDGKWNGRGTIYFKNGEYIVANFLNDKAVGVGIRYDRHGNVVDDNVDLSDF